MKAPALAFLQTVAGFLRDGVTAEVAIGRLRNLDVPRLLASVFQLGTVARTHRERHVEGVLARALARVGLRVDPLRLAILRDLALEIVDDANASPAERVEQCDSTSSSPSPAP